MARRRDDSQVAAKNYVLDTNVLLHDPQALYAFADNNVIIPIYVIEEIDSFKKDQSELGRNARMVARLLDKHRADGGLSQPQPTDVGGTVRVALSKSPPKNPSYDSRTMDQRILEVALEVAAQDRETPTILVTKDVNMRIRGDALGLVTVDYEPEHISIDELYPGSREMAVDSGIIDVLYAEGAVAVPAADLTANEYVLLRDDASGKSALGRYDKPTAKVVGIKKLRDGVWGIKPRNKEQHYALDLLLNDDVKLVTLVGKAGTGKTLMALAAGLQKVTEEQVFHKLLVSRPIFPLGRDIGYLPGDIEEKLNPWMQPIYDNLELLLGLNRTDKKDGRSYAELMDLGFVEIEPLTYIRGRSLPNVFMIVDEAQNLTPHEVKTIITRAGEGTKIILTGDPYQIDHPYIDSSNNGLTTVAEKFKTEAISGHVSLTKGERSQLAELATQLL
ncbi:MAG: PhoH family protein [Kofleriaceae bacterium]|nr:PhoH family protein [Myxococcales bacterium]MCB9561728.1 PhoH family protein [Kofleriaceae bacterium]MCB9573723.1 PhoH family protein [Kofleriaceae bacterium]